MFFKIYKKSLSDWQRGKIKGVIFLFLRRLNFYWLLEAFKLFLCKSYRLISADNVDEVFAQNSIAFSVKTYEDNIRSSYSLNDDKLDDFKLSYFKSETIVLDIQEPEFSLRNNHLIDDKLNVIGGYRIPFKKLPIHNQFLSNPSSYEGIIAYLSDPAYLNYYHWMCGTLPFLATYKEYISLDEIDYFYVGEDGISKFHLESLARAGVSPEKILLNACTSSRILAGITNRFIGFNDPISYSSYVYTRQLFSEFLEYGLHQPKKRVYIKRGNVSRRRVLNEKVLLEFLEKKDFEIFQMDDKSIEEQAKIFSSAEIIVAPHGAALTNLLFVSPETRIIEILPNGYTNNCFSVLASHAGAKHFYLQGQPTEAFNSNTQEFDIRVDVNKLSLLLEKVGI